MPATLSPELVLVLPEEQRAAAIRALPAAPVWNPGPLGLPVIARGRAVHVLVASALAYFAVRLVWTLGTAAVYVVMIVAAIIALTLIL